MSKKTSVPHKVLSDHGVRLEEAHKRQHCGSIGYGQKVVIGQNNDGTDIIVKQGQRCPDCRKRVRGPNHADGMHHKGIVPKNAR